jgi:phage tail-like protein
MSDKENKKENSSSFTPSTGFYFVLKINNDSADVGQINFQEVSGINTEMNELGVAEGGENRFVHRLPAMNKHHNLVLKRGLAAKNTALFKWINSSMVGGLLDPIEPKTLRVDLLDSGNKIIISWVFQDAYPVNWAIADFKPTENNVAVDTIEFAYSFFKRLEGV